jgi:hypothetical protein
MNQESADRSRSTAPCWDEFKELRSGDSMRAPIRNDQ